MHSYYADAFLQELPAATTTSSGHYLVTWLDSKEQLQEEKEKYRTITIHLYGFFLIYSYYFLTMICYEVVGAAGIFIAQIISCLLGELR